MQPQKHNFSFALVLCWVLCKTNGQSSSSSYCNAGSTYDPKTKKCVDCAQQFCNFPADESAYVQGPFIRPQNLLLFSGICVLEYSEDFSNNKLNVTVAPTTISSYLNQLVITGPITLAYETFPPDIAKNDYQLNLVDQSGILIGCPTSSSSAAVINCTSTVPGKGTVQLTKASSASSQLEFSQPDGLANGLAFYQYGVIPPANTELGLFNANFSTLYSQSTGFLSNQTTITKITGLQFFRDLSGPSEFLFLGVFGTDAYGVASLGYTTYDDPFPFSRTANFTKFTWFGEPKPLRSQFEGGFTCP